MRRPTPNLIRACASGPNRAQKKGKLGRAILDTTISGVAFEMLKTVDMVSDEVVWASSGYCGKKQLMPVGLGGPALRCRVTIGGR